MAGYAGRDHQLKIIPYVMPTVWEPVLAGQRPIGWRMSVTTDYGDGPNSAYTWSARFYVVCMDLT